MIQDRIAHGGSTLNKETQDQNVDHRFVSESLKNVFSMDTGTLYLFLFSVTEFKTKTANIRSVGKTVAKELSLLLEKSTH